MTLGANVKLVPENVIYGETLEDYTITADYNLPPAKRTAQVPALGDAYPGDRYLAAQTAPWGYIVIETGSATSHRTPDQGAYTTRVQYAKPKVPFTSGVTGLYEVARRPETGRRGRRMGIRVFLAAEADAEAIADASLPELVPMAASGNWQYALLREKQIEHRWRVGIAKITAVYDSYAPIGDVIYVNKGILEADATAVMMWNREVVPGTTRRIDEIYFDAADSNVPKQWVRVAGNNGWPLVKANLRIRAVLTSSNLAAIKGLVGTVNSDACPNILNAGAGTLWFDKFSMRQRQRGQSTLYDCIIGLAADPLGWDSRTLAQLQKYEVRQAPVLTVAGVDTGQKISRGSWVPNSGADPTKMPIPGNTANFSILNGYLT